MKIVVDAELKRRGLISVKDLISELEAENQIEVEHDESEHVQTA